MRAWILAAIILGCMSQPSPAGPLDDFQSTPFVPRRPYGWVPDLPSAPAPIPAPAPQVLLAPQALAGWPPAGWSPTLFEGFTRAIEDHKLLVVLFTERDCPWCARLEGVILADDRFAKLQAQAVFAFAEPGNEDIKGNNAKIMRDLGIERVPTLVLLDVKTDRIDELVRVTGFKSADEIMAVFQSARRATQ
jgi:Thioredoxin-like domain